MSCNRPDFWLLLKSGRSGSWRPAFLPVCGGLELGRLSPPGAQESPLPMLPYLVLLFAPSPMEQRAHSPRGIYVLDHCILCPHSRNVGCLSVRTGSPVPESGCVSQTPSEGCKFICKLYSAQQMGEAETQTWKPFTVPFGIAGVQHVPACSTTHSYLHSGLHS